MTVGELAAPLQMSFAAAAKHIKVLEGAELVRRTITGRRHVCSLRAEPLSDATTWLRYYARFWDDRLDTLQSVLEGAAADPAASPDKEEHHHAEP